MRCTGLEPKRPFQRILLYTDHSDHSDHIVYGDYGDYGDQSEEKMVGGGHKRATPTSFSNGVETRGNLVTVRECLNILGEIP